MTLALGLLSRDTMWAVVDRRLTYDDGRAPVDTAMKVFNLETHDAVGLFVYAGLGATPHGTEPSAWLSALFRGRHGQTFDQAMVLLTQAMTEQFSSHLRALNDGHAFVVPVFRVPDGGHMLYIVMPVSGPAEFGVGVISEDSARPSRLALAGSGGGFLEREWRRDSTEMRDLFRLVKANDLGKVSDIAVADRLAALNSRVSERVDTVSPASLVVWRRRRDCRRAASGGGHQGYSGAQRDLSGSTVIPTIANGSDVSALVGLIGQNVVVRGDGPGFDIDLDAVNVGLQSLPSEPDERLE